MAEVARRKLDLHNQITDALVKESYNFEGRLGKGASGEVLLVSNKLTGVKYACKIIAKNDSMNDAQSMSTEMEIMKRIRHRNIVSMYELYESTKCLWVILSLSLCHIIFTNTYLDNRLYWNWLTEAISTIIFPKLVTTQK